MKCYGNLAYKPIGWNHENKRNIFAKELAIAHTMLAIKLPLFGKLVNLLNVKLF